MTFPTIPHHWAACHGAIEARPDLLARADRFGVVDAPGDWPARVSLWAMGAILAVGRGSPAPDAPDGPAARFPLDALPLPEAPALLVFPDGPGPIWAYSARAVFQAARAASAFGLGHVVGGQPDVGFWNGCAGERGQTRFVPAPSALPEFRAYTDGVRTLHFHPRLLGPVLIGRTRSREWAPGLYVAGFSLHARPRLRFRGEVVPIGWFEAGRVRPLALPGGLWE